MFGIRSRASVTTAGNVQAAQRKVQEIYQSTPENQCCADCTSRLNDSVWASTSVGAFLCIHCAGAHRKLGVQVSRVKSLLLDAWTDEDVPAMKGGNKRVYELYAKHIDKWIAVDASYALQPNSEVGPREQFIRAKYEDMRFTRMPPSPSAQNMPIVTEEKDQDTPEHPEDSFGLSSSANAGSPTASTVSSASSRSPTQHRENQQRSPVQKPIKNGGNQDKAKSRNVIEVTKRFTNYFVVLGRGALVTDQSLEKTKGPTDLQFTPTVLDSYPEQFDDSPVPSLLAQFAFPEGYALAQSYLPPTSFSFVLTNVSGVKIYACALKFYEELHPLEVVSLLAPYYRQFKRSQSGVPNKSTDNNNNQASEMPKWVQDISGSMSNSPGPVFCPKCIVVTSHYPYFSAFRQFLQQVYRITLSEAPMPIERYITNFVSEVPLPPRGQIQVQLTLPDRNLVISRPPHNELPLVDFSFRPLFQALDVNNVLQLFTCAVLEYKIVLCSKHIALLTPVAEAILSVLLPFSWQGAYIPVLPSSLLDVIDAPVPFLVGMHADCMKQAASQTSGVVFVDLDHNRVIPAVDEDGRTLPIPKLPEREGAKLRVKLSEYGNIFDPFTTGLSKIDLAFPNEEHLEPIGNFASESGHTVPLVKSISESNITESAGSIYSMGKIMRGRKPSGAQSSSTASSSSNSPSLVSSPVLRNSSQASPSRLSSSSSSTFCGVVPLDGMGGLSDSRYNEMENFSTEGIRKAFLRFFVTLLKKYAGYLTASAAHGYKPTDSLFDGETFVRENCDAASRSFVTQLIATQMFDRFIEDRVLNPHLPEVLFFDQSINQKLNRSLTIGKKKYDCTFLDDKSDDIRETFIAPPPSNIGLPDDGTVYRYKSFPRLKKALFGNVRAPRELFTSREQSKISPVDFHHRIFTMSRCLKGSTATWEATRRLIIHLQTQYRMYSARKKYLGLKKAAVIIQRWTIAHLKGKADRQRYLELRGAAVVCQKNVRMILARKSYRVQRDALDKLQHFVHGYIQFSRYQRAKRGIRRLQAQWRSSFHKRSYKNLKHQIIRVQSRARGFLSRKRTMRWKEDLFEGYRRKIFDLWEQCNVPLLHRSKFWLTFNRPDFFNLGVFSEEERRLQAYFRDTHAAHDAYEYSIQTQLVSANNKKNGVKKALRSMIKPKNGQSDGRKSIGDVAGIRIEEERQHLYEILKKQTSVTVRTAFYKQFGIAVDSKKKKRRLANLVWTTYGEAATSAEIVVTVSCSSDRHHPLPAQIDRHKQIRIRDDLTFTVNAALKSIRYASHPESSLMQPKERELIELQHQVRMLAAQNHRLTGELMASQREMSRLQMELQLQQQPQLRKVTSERSIA
ncbi:hypothetical protein Poli38472_000590 [Pythium oligandrum]|uniref:Uncharacterized protein n=1 Tax=Pythium oligandrum TaxID=41045 RepID=A0A8K1CDD8_PYTOL|nr:hypothetical protein Poli38472_000590 [Pythium oligandrum]|eukprot:TMW60548.1 hypothetical protein Poli38472_000590 [Pythium oligandrum]